MISTTNTAAMHSTSENLDSAFSTYMIVCYKRSCDLGNQRKPGCDSVYEFDPVAPEFYWLAHVAHDSGPVERVKSGDQGCSAVITGLLGQRIEFKLFWKISEMAGNLFLNS